MKKYLLALCLLTSNAWATWNAYYTGASYLPSAATDSLYLSPDAVFSNIANPSTPTPAVADRWFINPLTTAGYARLPVSSLGSASGTLAFYWNKTAAASQTYDVIRITNSLGVTLLRVAYEGSTTRFRVYYGATNVANTDAVSPLVNHTIIIRYDTSGGSIKVDSEDAITNAQSLSLVSAANFYVGGSPTLGAVAGATTNFIDGFGVSNDDGDSFPPTPATITSTHTPSGTPTFTATPTRTSTATPSNTANGTFTNTPVVTFTNTSTSTATPSRTITLTSTATPTATPTFTSTITASWTSTNTVTKTITHTITSTTTISATLTSTPTFTSTITLTSVYTQVQTAIPTPNYGKAGEFVSFWPCSNMSYQGTAVGATYPSGTLGTSAFYVSGSAWARASISVSGETANYFQSNSLVAPAGVTSGALILPAGESAVLSSSMAKYVHVYFPGGAGTVSIRVENCY